MQAPQSSIYYNLAPQPLPFYAPLSESVPQNADIVCGRNNTLSLETNEQHLFYLDPCHNAAVRQPPGFMYMHSDTELSTTAKLLATSSALRSPIMTHSPHRLTPLGSLTSLNSPLTPSSMGSNVLPPVSTFMFPGSYRSMDNDWWDKANQDVSNSSMKSSPDNAAALEDIYYHGMINGTNEYSFVHSSSSTTTAAL